MKLDDVFAILRPDLAVDTLPVSPGLYGELDDRYEGFAGHVLVSVHTFDSDWPTWERHPAGDEIVVLLEGDARLVLRRDDGFTEIEMNQSGEFVVVPKGAWHTAQTRVPTRMLFMTPGEGTENEADPS